MAIGCCGQAPVRIAHAGLIMTITQRAPRTLTVIHPTARVWPVACPTLLFPFPLPLSVEIQHYRLRFWASRHAARASTALTLTW